MQLPTTKKSISVPIKQLKGFKRVSIQHGKTEFVEILIDKAQLRFWDEGQAKFVTPKGIFQIMVGASSEDIRLNQSLKL